MPMTGQVSPAATLDPTILIVNGDDATRAWITATVVSSGLRAVSMATASELLSRITPDMIACAIIDMTLPDANGLELQLDLGRLGLPTLFLTRDRCIASCVKAVKAGAVDFLTIPCNSTSLVRALRDAVTQAKASFVQRMRIDELRSKYELLTPREREVFTLVAGGLRNKQIAFQLDISQITVQIHRGQVMRKMAARSFASLVRMSDALQLSRPDPRHVE
jgi:FixJ family two-component response regulator